MLDALHHGPQARLRADDRVGDVLTIEPRQEGLFVGLERFAQRLHLAEPRFVLEGGGKRLQQLLHQLDVPRRERPRRLADDDQESQRRLAFVGERAHEQWQLLGERVEAGRRQFRRAARRDRFAGAGRRGAFDALGDVAALAPLEQRRQLGLPQRRLRRRHTRARAGEAGSHRLEARAGAIDAANDKRVERQRLGQSRQEAFDRFVNLEVSTDFSPDVEDQLHL